MKHLMTHGSNSMINNAKKEKIATKMWNKLSGKLIE